MLKKVLFVIPIVLMFSCANEKLSKKNEEQEGLPEAAEDNSIKVSMDSAIQNQKYYHEDFAIVGRARDSFCLIGKHRLRDKVTLVDISKRKTFEGVTAGYPKEKWFQNEWVATTVASNIKPSKDEKNIDFAVVKKHKKFEFENGIETKDTSLVKTIDSLIRIKPLNEIYADIGSLDSENLQKPQEIEKYDNLQNAFYIFTFLSSQGGHKGPIWLYMNDEAYSLAGPCSYGHNVFTLDGEVYVYIVSLCCDCNGSEVKIYKVEKEGVVLVFNKDTTY